MANEKTKISLVDITEKEEAKYLQATIDALNSVEKEIKAIGKLFKGKDAQVRSFLAETLLHIVFASSRLSPSVITALLEKVKATQLGINISGNMPIPRVTNKLAESYVG